MSTLTTYDSTLFEFNTSKGQWIEKTSGELTFLVNKELVLSINDYSFVILSHIQPKGPSAIAMRVTTNNQFGSNEELIIAVRFARELDVRNLFTMLSRYPALDYTPLQRWRRLNRRVPSWFLAMDSSQQQNIEGLVSRAETKLFEDGFIQRLLAQTHKLSPMQIDEVIDLFQPWRRGKPGGGTNRHNRQHGSHCFDNLPSIYNPLLSRTVINPAIYQGNVSPNQGADKWVQGSRQNQSEVTPAQQLHLEYKKDFPTLKLQEEDQARTENLMNNCGITGPNLNPRNNVAGNQRVNFQENHSPTANRSNQNLRYPMQHFRRSRLSAPTTPAPRQRVRHASLMTPEGTYIPTDKFFRTRTPSAQLFFQSDRAYAALEQIPNSDARMHNHTDLKQFNIEHVPSNNWPCPAANAHHLSMDYLNPNTLKRQRNLGGLKEEKFSDTGILEENFMNSGTGKLNRSVSAPTDSQRTYPLTVKNLASYNKRVAPFKGDYKTIVRRWLNKSLSN